MVSGGYAERPLLKILNLNSQILLVSKTVVGESADLELVASLANLPIILKE